MEYINNYNEKCQYKNIRIHNKLKKNSQNVNETLTFFFNSTIVVLDRNTR